MGEHARDLFDEVTAVNDAPLPRDALPTNAIEPIVLIEPVGIAEPVPLKANIDLAPLAIPEPIVDAIVTPLAEPPRAEATPVVRPVLSRSSRSWHAVSISIAIACVLMTASVAVWAHDEVRVAREAQAAQRRELRMTHEVTQPPASPPVAAAAPAPVPCSSDEPPEADVPLKLERTKRHHHSSHAQ